jgi:acyl-[acyl-carrier-protein]-phospholipid O-acyltransferase/long-chain-fatty-acid--[acyl-carrier-protein] ligase
MGTQATFFSPAKYGIVPELLADEDLSRANGLLEMSTFLAIVLGTAVGGPMYVAWRGQPALVGLTLVAIAVIGTLTSLRIPRVVAVQSSQPVTLDPFSDSWRGLKHLFAERNLWMTTVGISFFWFLGALVQLALPLIGRDTLHVGPDQITLLLTALALGIGGGSLLAGRLSGDKIELGLVPIGSLGMGAFGLLLGGATSYAMTATALVLLGFFGGLFVVPLNALLQQKPAADERGLILATNNILNTIGIILASAMLWFSGDAWGWSTGRLIVVVSVLTLVANVYVLSIVPDFFVRFVLWSLTHLVYRIRIIGKPHVPARGPALIICNHVSLIDGALVGACIQRFVRFVVFRPIYDKPGLNWLLRRLKAIPIDAGSKRAVLESIERARSELRAGHVVCIFAEGSVSRTGNMLPFKRGFERMVDGLDVPIIPVYLDRVWGSVFSFKRGRFIWKWPERFPYPVTVAFGTPMPAATTASQARLAILELGADVATSRRPKTDLLQLEFMRRSKRQWGTLGVADSTGQKLTRGRTLVASLLLSRVIAKRCADDEMVGLLLPASVGGALANIATLMAGKISVNLNFTAGTDAMAVATEECGIRTVLTSRRFLSKAAIEPTPSMVFLEDLAKEIGAVSKLLTLVEARLLPVAWLRGRAGAAGKTIDSVATVIFSSGSTGIPKGVMLSHRNVLANIDALVQIFPVSAADCLVGVLPFFHSFGFTGTLWFPLITGIGVTYHPNPMDAKTVGELAGTYQATMLISTPTFCNAYLRRCTKEQFAHLRYAIVGAEKLREPLATAFKEQFGVDLSEGYGCTEMSPVVAVNSPDIADGRVLQLGSRAGSVGHPIPGVAAKIVDLETGEGPLLGRAGLLLVKGASRMVGYLHQPEKTADVVRDGWYVTGDLAMMDDEGFLFITDRVSRFSKIGGEMVPHIKIEETINSILGDAASVVTAVPDAAKGERLVAFYTRPDVDAATLWSQLSATDLPKLWLPRRDNLFQIDAIPTLGTGKVDLRRVRDLARERCGEA